MQLEALERATEAALVARRAQGLPEWVGREDAQNILGVSRRDLDALTDAKALVVDRSGQGGKVRYWIASLWQHSNTRAMQASAPQTPRKSVFDLMKNAPSQ